MKLEPVFSDVAKLPTEHGELLVRAFHSGDDLPHLIIYRDLENFSGASVPVRIHSECLTGESLGSLRCDCRSQLIFAIEYIARNGGVVIYLRQEGRGIGLFHKINAYHLQDQGMNTIEANHKLGFDTDTRDFAVAVKVLAFLTITSVRLLTNNPLKITYLRSHGIDVTERLAIPSHPNRYNASYLRTKKEVLGHDIPLA
ncbi:MAG: GTP cyclohydrolase II [Verrucomicrobia bacterium]|nr:GTP cyclohydrolase II [Verrucomicrobiota bacterium]